MALSFAPLRVHAITADNVAGLVANGDTMQQMVLIGGNAYTVTVRVTAQRCLANLIPGSRAYATHRDAPNAAKVQKVIATLPADAETRKTILELLLHKYEPAFVIALVYKTLVATFSPNTRKRLYDEIETLMTAHPGLFNEREPTREVAAVAAAAAAAAPAQLPAGEPAAMVAAAPAREELPDISLRAYGYRIAGDRCDGALCGPLDEAIGRHGYYAVLARLTVLAAYHAENERYHSRIREDIAYVMDFYGPGA
jgi:hypothetical protein